MTQLSTSNQCWFSALPVSFPSDADSSHHRAHPKPLPKKVSSNPVSRAREFSEFCSSHPTPFDCRQNLFYTIFKCSCLLQVGLVEVGSLVQSPQHLARATGLRKGFVNWKHPISFSLPPSDSPVPLTLLLISWPITSRKRTFNASLTLLQKEFMMVYSFLTLSFKASTWATFQHWGDATKSRSLANTQ